MLEALPAGQPPRLVGPYRLLARLGAGGMGEVHLACRADEPTADPYRMVAVKTVREDLEVDGDFRVRFRREITAARAVSGPYAAALVDADADAPVPWLATEYVPGPSLAEAVVRSGALPIAAVRAVGAALARALEAVHGAKVLHRDLKPANVLLGAAGPKLIDFGIAQAFEATALTSTGLVVGSPGFMSPEHLTGSRAVVPASDVFCLGAVLAFAASGRGPFHDDEMAAVVYRISRADAELEGVPEELRPVVERCLRLDPAERPSAAELVELLGSEVPTAFPWPGGVLAQLSEYGDAARRIGEAAASGAGVADLPTVVAPQVPYSPTAAGYRPAAASEPSASRPSRGRWGRFAAGAVAVAVLAAVGVVMSDRLGAEGGSGGATGGAGGATPSASAAPATLSRVVLPYGGEGHANDFGPAGADRSSRPAGWSPWAKRIGAGPGPCALGPEVMVCSGAGGAVTALRSADGEVLWSKPGRGEAPRASPQYPAVVGDQVAVTGPDGVVSYAVADGGERWRRPAPDGDWAVKGTDLHDGVLYATYVNVRDERSGLVTAVRPAEGGKELWRTPLDVLPEQPVAAGGSVFVPGNGMVLALDARTGEETARGSDENGCYSVLVHKERVLCPSASGGGVAVLDGRSLKRLRTLGEGVLIVGAPAVNSRGVVGLSDGDTLYTYDLESGEERWRRPASTTAEQVERVWFAGDRLLSAAGTTVVSLPLENPPTDAHAYDSIGFTQPGNDDAVYQGASTVLAAGGAVFLALSDGLVVSGYLP
ncbi:serine/threonine-protein kinase [Streptomyces sp. NPDC006551]|uniref:serine/threonine-protein kinase n=1 Tax=Streptomyces sp. NPDC006551 TaxID=3157178 RepID=UPI0033B7990F